jgi:serine/threonine-protein kinase
MAGERVAGKYELKRLLGEGAMGAVYEGVHVDLGKRLAIKLIRPEFCESPDVVARFRREARAASAVESQYIAQIFDFGRDEARGLYMVIEYLVGEDLETRIVRERWIDETDAATIGLHVARGLARAHAAGIVHRDLKPANVFLTRRDDGSLLAKILDFGISKVDALAAAGGGSGAEPEITAYGTTLGTPQYMSPEQCTGKVALDGRTDVWSLCAVLYELLAGEPAVSSAGGHIAMMQRIVREDVPPLRTRGSWVSPALARVIDEGLVRDRDGRIRDAATLAAKLHEAYPDAGTHSSLHVSSLHVGAVLRPNDAAAVTPPQRAPQQPRSHPQPQQPAPEDVRDDVHDTFAELPTSEMLAAGAIAMGPLEHPEQSGARLADRRTPQSSAPPSSEPQSDRGDSEDFEIFARGRLPSEVVALRSARKSSRS